MRNNVKVQVSHTLPRPRPTGVQHTNPRSPQRNLHGQRNRPNQPPSSRKRNRRSILHPHGMLTRHHQRVPRSKRPRRKRQERNGIRRLSHPLSSQATGHDRTKDARHPAMRSDVRPAVLPDQPFPPDQSPRISPQPRDPDPP